MKYDLTAKTLYLVSCCSGELNSLWLSSERANKKQERKRNGRTNHAPLLDLKAKLEESLLLQLLELVNGSLTFNWLVQLRFCQETEEDTFPCSPSSNLIDLHSMKGGFWPIWKSHHLARCEILLKLLASYRNWKYTVVHLPLHFVSTFKSQFVNFFVSNYLYPNMIRKMISYAWWTPIQAMSFSIRRPAEAEALSRYNVKR